MKKLKNTVSAFSRKVYRAMINGLILFNIFILGIQAMAIDVSEIKLQDTLNDIDIARAIIGQKVSDLDRIADSLNIELDYDGSSSIFVTYDGATKEFIFSQMDYYTKTGPGSKERHLGVGDIFIRYKNSEYKHFSHFRAAKVPQNDSLYKYDKSQGRKLSHIKVEYK